MYMCMNIIVSCMSICAYIAYLYVLHDYVLELGTGTEERTVFFPVILDRTGFLYRCTMLYLTVRHAESC